MITAVVLAAGAGERLGGNKALARLGGEPFLAHVLRACNASLVDAAVVVGGAESEPLRELCKAIADDLNEMPITFVANDAWEQGRTGSLIAGWSHVAQGSHVLVFPVDHPAVDVVTLDTLLGVFCYAAALPDVVVPVVETDGRRRRGHPVVVNATLADAVRALGPDEPLRDLVHRSTVLEVPVDDSGIFLDVNDASDLERAAALVASRATDRARRSQ